MTIRRRAVLAALPAALAAPRIARAADRTKVILWHAMAATPGAEINKLIDKFNASQNQVEVTGLFKGVYKDLHDGGRRRVASGRGAAYRPGVRGWYRKP